MNAGSGLVLTGLALGLGVGAVPARCEDVGAHARQTPHAVILERLVPPLLGAPPPPERRE